MLKKAIFKYLFILQYCYNCLTVSVPVVQNSVNSALYHKQWKKYPSINSDIYLMQASNIHQPKEYFSYPVNKPEFAIEVAAFHGVQEPDKLYSSHPIKPKSKNKSKKFSKHDKKKPIYNQYQKFVETQEALKSNLLHPEANKGITFRPYKLEEGELKKLYKDETLQKVRTDVNNAKTRLQNYEIKAGEPNLSKDEYLESPDETDRKLFPAYIPTNLEIHRAQRRPVYYFEPERYRARYINNQLNLKLKHPQYQNFVKIKPASYQPLMNHLHKLRYNLATKYDDERNEYPQMSLNEELTEPSDGIDIYEKGKERYAVTRNNIEEALKNYPSQERPGKYVRLPENYQKLPVKSKNKENIDFGNLDEFVPIKSYAQVRKINTKIHLPREAAEDDASNDEELENAPRLREAVTSHKAQTVYSEEGYEDSAYDHAGEHKHASDHEHHAGRLKDSESSEGIFKIPTSIADDALTESSNNDEQKEYYNEPNDDNEDYGNDSEHIITEHDVSKRQVSQDEHAKLQLEKNNGLSKYSAIPSKNQNAMVLNLHDKYPYYAQMVSAFHKDSPLKYAENFKLIPKKRKGEYQFYESTAGFKCPEVDGEDEELIPDEVKKRSSSSSSESPESAQEEDKTSGNKHKLKGLGDKIDCFKAKFFGSNPLDSPFFQEDLVNNPISSHISLQIERTNDKIELPIKHNLKFNSDNKTLPKSLDFNNFTILPFFQKSEFIKHPEIFSNLNKKKTQYSSLRLPKYSYFNKITEVVPSTMEIKNEYLTNSNMKNNASVNSMHNNRINTEKEKNASNLTRSLNDLTRLKRNIVYRNKNKPIKNDQETTETVNIDSRRNEPRYEVIKRRKNKINREQEESLEETNYTKKSNSDENSRESSITPIFAKKMSEKHIEFTNNEKIKTNNTAKPHKNKNNAVKKNKLQLVTRFNQPHSFEESKEKFDTIILLPQYKEKKKISAKNTLVTDTKSYGQDENEMKEDEVDELIGLKHNMDDYIPDYEKKETDKSKSEKYTLEDEYKMKSSEDDYISDEDESKADDDYYITSEEQNDESSDEENYDSIEHDQTEQENKQLDTKIILTTPEPIPNTAPRTTENPHITTETLKILRSLKPLVVKKIKTIHSENPVTRNSTSSSYFKQNVEEEEVTKTLPKSQKIIKIPYSSKLKKPDNQINREDVVIFKENLDIANSPKHGGNYIHIELFPQNNPNNLSKPINNDSSKKFNELSNLNNSNVVNTRMHGGNLKIYKKPENFNDDVVNESTSSSIEPLEETKEENLHYEKNYDELKQIPVKQKHNHREPIQAAKDKKTQSQLKEGNESITTSTISYELDPNKRLYFYVDV